MHVQATVCALLGLQCIVYMGATDIERQKLNVFRMRLLGAEVRSRVHTACGCSGSACALPRQSASVCVAVMPTRYGATPGCAGVHVPHTHS